MNKKLIRLNGTIIKKSICDHLGIYKRHVKVNVGSLSGSNDDSQSRWDVWIDGFEMPYWWCVPDNTKFVSSEYIEDTTENFCKRIKCKQVRKFINNKPVIFEVNQIISKLTLEYKLDLLR